MLAEFEMKSVHSQMIDSLDVHHQEVQTVLIEEGLSVTTGEMQIKMSQTGTFIQ